MRQSSLRSQRSKGLRLKQVFQVCVLAAICLWLLYQLKHSYDKKRAIEEMNATISERVKLSRTNLFKLGRKDLPYDETTGTAVETHVKDDENEEAEEEEEQETKQENENEASRGAGDEEFDETGEQDQKVDEEEDKNALIDGADLLDEEEHEGGSREAREENYKKDDASSAVRHDDGERVGGSREAREEQYTKDDASSAVRRDDETMETVFGHEGARRNEENMEHEERDVERTVNETVDSSQVNGDSDAITSEGANGNASTVALGGNFTVLNDNLSKNGTSVENRRHEFEFSKLEVQSLSNSTSAEYGSPKELLTNWTASTGNNNQMELQANTAADVLTNHTEAQNNSTEVDSALNRTPLQNETVQLDSVQDRNATSVVEIAGEIKSNMADVATKPPGKSKTSLNGDAGQGGSDDSSQMEKSNTSGNNVAAQGEVSRPLQLEKSNISENGDAAQGEIIDPSHKTVEAKEREAPTDLSTE